MSGSEWETTPSWLSRLSRTFLPSYSVYFFHVFLISSASTMSLPFLSFIMPIFGWNVPLIFPIYWKSSLVLPFLWFSSISLHCSLKKVFLSLLLFSGTLHWERVYLSQKKRRENWKGTWILTLCTSLSRLPFHSEETIKHILIKPAEAVGDPPQVSFLPLSKTKLWEFSKPKEDPLKFSEEFRILIRVYDLALPLSAYAHAGVPWESPKTGTRSRMVQFWG